MRLHKGDRVRVLRGKDRGATGEISRVLPKSGRVIVDGVNRVKKHQKATRATMQGGIIDKDMPISASAVALICGSCGPSRVGYRVDENGVKTRICKKCENEF
ncbi:MAG TPA: 50S ribosomal protein L24 [Acidimicrobiales bacterium]|nr:50S ribosomal protein L24 [Acidimicrobiales bacterium]